jgi:hypothetical protein
MSIRNLCQACKQAEATTSGYCFECDCEIAEDMHRLDLQHAYELLEEEATREGWTRKETLR